MNHLLPLTRFVHGFYCTESVTWCAVWTFSFCVSQSPEGRTENSPGLEAWEDLRKENRPERAADFGTLFPRGNLRQKRLDGISETTNWRPIPFGRPFSFQGDSVLRVVPRAEAPTPQSLRRGIRFQDTGEPKRSEGGLGYSLFALRARRNVRPRDQVCN